MNLTSRGFRPVELATHFEKLCCAVGVQNVSIFTPVISANLEILSHSKRKGNAYLSNKSTILNDQNILYCRPLFSSLCAMQHENMLLIFFLHSKSNS